MKKLAGIVIILVISLTSVFAQGKMGKMSEMFERLRAEKISYITLQLDLTPAEAQVFWPVYNEFEKQRLALEKAKRPQSLRNKKQGDNASEADLKKMNEAFINSFAEEAALMKEYNRKFLEVLSVDKVMKLYQAERGFRSHMLHEYRNRGDRPERAPKIPDERGDDGLME